MQNANQFGAASVNVQQSRNNNDDLARISGYLSADSRKVYKDKFKFLINYSPGLIQKNFIEPGCMES